jgi:hypothetical protein
MIHYTTMSRGRSIPTSFEQALENLSNWHEHFRFDRENSTFVINAVWKPVNCDHVISGILGEALLRDLQNERPLVRHLNIALNVIGFEIFMYQSLLAYIEFARLESVALDGNGRDLMVRMSLTASSRFLRAVRRNTKIKRLRIFGWCAHDLVWIEFLQNCSIEALEIDCTFVHSLENSSSMGPIAAAFRDNRTIQEIHFDLNEDTLSSVLEIFTQLPYNTSIHYLSLEWSPSSAMPIQAESDYSVDIDTIMALAKLVATSSSLRHIHLIDFEFVYIEPFLTALDVNPSINKLSFERCRWDDASMAVTTYWLGRLRHIERMQVDFCIPDQRNRDRMEQWMQVMRHNPILQEVQWTLTNCVRDEEWKQRLLRRNQGVRKFLRQFLDPSLKYSTGPNIPTVMVPHILARLSECWHSRTWIFQALSNGSITAEYTN